MREAPYLLGRLDAIARYCDRERFSTLESTAWCWLKNRLFIARVASAVSRGGDAYIIIRRRGETETLEAAVRRELFEDGRSTVLSFEIDALSSFEFEQVSRDSEFFVIRILARGGCAETSRILREVASNAIARRENPLRAALDLI